MASLEDKAPPPVDSSSEEALKNEDILSSPPKKVSFFKRIWDKSGLNIGMLVLMAKYEVSWATSFSKAEVQSGELCLRLYHWQCEPLC